MSKENRHALETSRDDLAENGTERIFAQQHRCGSAYLVGRLS
jgi:hypothetical protein